ncbi:ABC-three component system protein [Bosea psychrotolerans]|uniref:ABC-three component systems C-terminal domain-containing protein n=1 Tax=Bosea psychrotolerans TaxID=1871628 RepID=A0A2S4MD58_9HYPH|nr:ABC-three component system protein [Bosea psychrotolerans]POR52565.1 hypothetical protein CYD53_105230 [Bosea psychrotolerans]
MSVQPPATIHTAEDAALGFYYQTYFAFLTLLQQTGDDAGVGIERLDDVELKVDGHLLLYQLKHSIKAVPPPITMKSRALWRTLKVWIDALIHVELAQTTMHLVVVGPLGAASPLNALLDLDADRDDLAASLIAEAQLVHDARAAAKSAGTKLPHDDRADGCAAFLDLEPAVRSNLLRRILIKPDSPPIDQVEVLAAQHLTLIAPEQRADVVKRLLGWWDTEVVHALCGKRDPIVTRAELQAQITSVIADLESSTLQADFELLLPPGDYQPDGMVARQIKLVAGGNSDLSKAIREEWRAREQRAKWLNDNSAMGTVVSQYDQVLEEAWSDKHGQMVEDCSEVEDTVKRERGLEMLRWTHDEAPAKVRPIAEKWSAPYYVRGSYQVLAIDLRVGWHPEYVDLLKDGGE